MTRVAFAVFIGAAWCIQVGGARGNVGISLDLQSCPSLDGTEVRKLLGIEFAAAHLEEDVALRIKASCDAGMVTAEAEDNVVGRVQRQMHWSHVGASARPRLFALAVAEMVVSAHREREPDPRASPLVPSRKVPVLERGHSAFSLRARLGAQFLGSVWSTAPVVALGGVWALSRHWSITSDVDGVTTQTTMLFGDVRALALGVSAGARVHGFFSQYTLAAELAPVLSAVRFSGASDDARLEGNARFVPWLSAALRVGVERRLGRHHLGLEAHARYTPQPPEARASSGRVVLQKAAFAGLSPALMLVWGYLL